MENLKKIVENINSGHARHPLAPDMEHVEGNIRHFNSGVAQHPIHHHIQKGKKLP